MSPGGADGDAVSLSEGEKRLGGLFREERQVDRFAREGALVAAAEQQQRLGEGDRSAVHGAEALVELAAVAVRIVAGDVEEGLRDGQRGAQLVGGVGGEPLLFGDLRLEPREHGVETVGQLAELVPAPLQLDPVRQRAPRRPARGVGDPRERGEHAAGEKPPSQEAERQEEHQGPGRLGDEGTHEVVPSGSREENADASGIGELRLVGHVAQQEHPHGREQHELGDHQEPGVAEGELEANTQTGRPIHGPRPPTRCPLRRRCGSRRRARWRSARARRGVCAAPRR